MLLGVALGHFAPSVTHGVTRLSVGATSIPIFAGRNLGNRFGPETQANATIPNMERVRTGR